MACLGTPALLVVLLTVAARGPWRAVVSASPDACSGTSCPAGDRGNIMLQLQKVATSEALAQTSELPYADEPYQCNGLSFDPATTAGACRDACTKAGAGCSVFQFGDDGKCWKGVASSCAAAETGYVVAVGGRKNNQDDGDDDSEGSDSGGDSPSTSVEDDGDDDSEGSDSGGDSPSTSVEDDGDDDSEGSDSGGDSPSTSGEVRRSCLWSKPKCGMISIWKNNTGVPKDWPDRAPEPEAGSAFCTSTFACPSKPLQMKAIHGCPSKGCTPKPVTIRCDAENGKTGSDLCPTCGGCMGYLKQGHPGYYYDQYQVAEGWPQTQAIAQYRHYYYHDQATTTPGTTTTSI